MRPAAAAAGAWHARVVRLPALLLVIALMAPACTLAGAAPGDSSPSAAQPVRIGSDPDPTSDLLAHVVRHLLRRAGIAGEVVPYASAVEARQALEFGDIDVLPGYTGAAWLDALGRADPPSDPQESFRRVRQADLRNDIVWLRPEFDASGGLDDPPANATFAFFVRGIPGADAGLRTMTQLATRLGEDPGERLCVDPGFARREDGLPALQQIYAIRDRIDVLGVQPEEAIRGVVAGGCLAGLSTATDGAAWAAGLVPLRDDLQVFPAFVVSIQVAEALTQERPEVLAALEPVPGRMTTRMLGTWNARVASEIPVEEVAAVAAAELAGLSGSPDGARETP